MEIFHFVSIFFFEVVVNFYLSFTNLFVRVKTNGIDVIMEFSLQTLGECGPPKGFCHLPSSKNSKRNTKIKTN